jgi:alpha-aminoadipic semialdehyde synthase
MGSVEELIMSLILGIRREDKNKWERRVPIIPDHVKDLKEKHNIQTIIQPSPIRIFSDDEFKKAGAQINEDLTECPVIFAVKEIPIDFFQENHTYVFFLHIIKGQEYNMPMLKKMMEMGCSLIDYEKITDEKNRRLVFFGHFAGLAGMIDTLWAFGQRVKWRGINSAFSEIKKTIEYDNLDDAKEHIKLVGKKIQQEGIPDFLAPLVIGFAGYGNVSQGAQEILDCLPVKEISPTQLEAIQDNYSCNVIYKVVFKEEDIVEHVSNEELFNLQEYYENPHLYRGIFHRYLKRLTILMNCIYWDKRYPRLITKYLLEEYFTGQMKLQVVGDISVDINGAIEFTEKTTTPDNPVYVYNPIRRDIIDGFAGTGVVVMAVDNLPCELPRESSKEFSDSLINFIPSIVKTDYSKNYHNLDLPDEIKKALILHNGRLTPDYQYINKYL